LTSTWPKSAPSAATTACAAATFADTDVPGYADRYVDFAEALEALFGRPVEVVIDRSIRNPRFRQAVDAARQPVYDDRNALAVA
jgi:hypothetical protein